MRRDDVANDENYPIIRMVSSNENVYYCRTTNWSSTAVAGGPLLQSVDFTLNRGMPAGNYSVILTGAGTPSFPSFMNITEAEVNGR